MLTRWLGIIALTTLAACTSTGTKEEIKARFTEAHEYEFEWDPIGVPAADVAMASVVAYGEAVQQVMVNGKAKMDFDVIDMYENQVKMELQGIDDPTKQQRRQAQKTVRATMTPGAVKALDAQASAVGIFGKTLAKELAKAGLTAMLLEQAKAALSDKNTMNAAKALGGLQGIQAVRQLDDALAMINQIIDMEGLLNYLEVNLAVTAGSGKGADV